MMRRKPEMGDESSLWAVRGITALESDDGLDAVGMYTGTRFTRQTDNWTWEKCLNDSKERLTKWKHPL